MACRSRRGCRWPAIKVGRQGDPLGAVLLRGECPVREGYLNTTDTEPSQHRTQSTPNPVNTEPSQRESSLEGEMRPPAGFGGCVHQDLAVGIYEEQIGIKSTPPQARLGPILGAIESWARRLETVAVRFNRLLWRQRARV
jgi:hypothetical protein